jgi:hypothetical protein
MTFARTASIISFETLRNDLWQACRQIRNAPGFAGAVILTLAAGFGISTAIFSIDARNPALLLWMPVGCAAGNIQPEILISPRAC